MLLNARMSDRSFSRWRRAPAIVEHLLAGFQHIQARSEQDADRLRQLGAAHLDCPGDLKFAALPLPVDHATLGQLRANLSGRPAWLAASTHPGEEALVAATHRRLAQTHPGLLTIIVPRHPERGKSLAAEFGATLRSAGYGPPAEGIWIADTVGELGLFYRLAPIAFVGRSLVPPGGGQNPLEPARLGCAIAVGPHTNNFADHVGLLREAGGLTTVADVDGLAEFVSAMVADPVRRRQMGEAAKSVTQGHADLPARTAETLLLMLRAPV